MFTNLEKELQLLGQMIAEDRASSESSQPSSSSSSPFTDHVEHWKGLLKKIHALEDQAESLRDKAIDIEFELMNQSLNEGPAPNSNQMKEVEELYKKATELANQANQLRSDNQLQNERNPLIKQLDETLQKFKVKRQSYHSRSFVGNHVNRCLKFNQVLTMSTKRASDGGVGGPPAKKGHWSLGLLDSMKDPELQVYKDDKVVIIKDKYPKAEFHYLVMPKENIPRLKSLKPDHLELLKHIHKVGEKVIKEAMEAANKSDVKYRLGYHAVPSMSHLHMHAISQDFNSPSLKTKKHWNSFTSAYFVDSKDVMKQLEEEDKVDTSDRKPDELLKLPLRCHVCKASLANMPKLKAHILTHLKSR